MEELRQRVILEDYTCKIDDKNVPALVKETQFHSCYVVKILLHNQQVKAITYFRN